MEDESVLWKSGSTSMASAMIGRVMNTLLSSRPKKLENAIVGLSDAPHNDPGALEESLRLLNKYVRAAVEEAEPLDDVLVPMIENLLQPKESKHVNQAMILLNWLFQDEVLFTRLANDLADILSRREDRYIALGWCRLIRSLVEYDKKMAQFLKNGIRDNYQALLKILSSSIRHLSGIVLNGSVLQDGFELPTRLSVAAADCILVLTEALTSKQSESRITSEKGSSRPSASNKPVSTHEGKQMAQINLDGGLWLWQQLDQLIVLVQKLCSWSQKSRSLHAKGLGQVLKWLVEIQKNYVLAQHEAGPQFEATGVLLLSSCWRHFSMLSLLEDSAFLQRVDELVEQYLSGIQFYTEGNVKDHMENRESCIETRKFFLTCLALLLGRLDYKRLETTTSVYGLRMSSILLSQLHCADDDIVDGAVYILRSAIFKMTGSYINNPNEMERLLPPLLDLLGECDAAARAITVLVAECCSISTNSWCLNEVLKRLASGSVPQRKNAIEILSEFIRLSTNSMKVASDPLWQDVANQLLEYLGDEESSIRSQAASLLPFIDPSLVLPKLVCSICSADGTVSSISSNAFLEILRHNNQKFDVISVMLDSLSNLCQSSGHSQSSGGSRGGISKIDPNGVFNLLPEWAKTVQDWNLLIGPLIDKMLSEPSNATIVKFLCSINDHVADAMDLVLHKLLSRAQQQERFSNSDMGKHMMLENENSDSTKHMVFDHLCPLLILKILPLRVFNDLNCTVMYGQTLNQCIAHGAEDFNFYNFECVATLLFDRAFSQFEYEDVRKLAAELCGRMHPQVLYPVVLSQLQHAVDIKDVLNMKACLFAICSSLAIRGWGLAPYLDVIKLVRILETVLLWPSLDGDEVSKVQHGCIDCLALMICAELQSPKPAIDSLSNKSLVITQNVSASQSSQGHILGSSVLDFVFDNLANDGIETEPSCEMVGDARFKTPVSISFRLCMANVLISTCQKISESGKKVFTQRTVPRLIQLAQVIINAAISGACVQVLFSAAYHLKSQIVPYARDLLKVSLDFLRKESEQEKMAGAKLLASLMASEDLVMENISGGLLLARPILLQLSNSDPSPQLRQICQKLLVCLTSQ